MKKKEMIDVARKDDKMPANDTPLPRTILLHLNFTVHDILTIASRECRMILLSPLLHNVYCISERCKIPHWHFYFTELTDKYIIIISASTKSAVKLPPRHSQSNYLGSIASRGSLRQSCRAPAKAAYTTFEN